MDAQVPRVCRQCGKDLGGVSHRGACPGCGTPVRSLLDSHGVAYRLRAEPGARVPEGPITTDVPCLTCGYTLRGLHTSARCPECGTAAVMSLMGGHLRYAGGAYLERLASGAFWVEVSLCVRAGGLAAVILLGSSGLGGQGIGTGTAVLTALVALPMSTWGWWQLTWEHTLLSRVGLRGWTRWLMAGSNALELMAIASIGGVAPSPAALASYLVPGAPCVTLSMALAWLVSIVLQLMYAAELLRRLPHPSLASTAATAAWVVPAVMVLSIPSGFLCFVVPPAGWLVVFVFYFVVVDRCRATFTGARLEAAAAQAGGDNV